MYALFLSVCLLNGECYGNGIEVYTEIELCESELLHQVMQGIPRDQLECAELVDETNDHLNKNMF